MNKILTILFLCIGFVAFSQSNFDIKDLLKPRTGKQTLVNDFANVLTADQKQALEDKLVQFDDSTSTQIAVIIIPGLQGYNIADLAVETGRAWGIGGKVNNNGVILLIAIEDKKLNISPGYGLEGALPDITCKQIIDGIIVPRFKGNDYYGGISNGVSAIIQAVQGEYTAPKGYHKKGKSGGRIIFYIILLILIIAISSGGRGGGTFMSRRGRRGFYGPIFWGSGFGGSSGSSSGGGGFGGFGGGSFGGGGASGSW